jgi:hypothetical protein
LIPCRLVAVAAALLAGCSSAPLQSDWERAHLSQTAPEDAVPPPRYPRAADLLPVDVPAPPGLRYFVDPRSLDVGRDHVVHYVLVARSAAGAESVSFEGIRCAPRQFRVYALGQAGGTWVGDPGPWQSTRQAEISPARRALADDYFCADGFPVRDAGEAVAALHRPPRVRLGGS